MVKQVATLDDVVQAINDQTADVRNLNVPQVDRAVTWFRSAAATSAPLFLKNPRRQMAIIVNTDPNDLWIRYGDDPASTASGGWTYKIPSGATWEMPKPSFTGAIQGIWTAAGGGIAEVTEF